MENLVDISTLLVSLVLVGFLTETVVEISKNFFGAKSSKTYITIVSLLTAMILCFALQVSLFESTDAVPYYIGIVICGLVASRGSNYVHNFLGEMPQKPKQ